jgi:hypothetical protein
MGFYVAQIAQNEKGNGQMDRAASVSASSTLIMTVADETASSDNGSLGSVDAWA